MQVPVKDQIEKKIRENLNADYLLVEDESWQHGGGSHAQSHFKIVAVCKSFEGMRLLARHRLIQEALSTIIAQVRAISLHTLTPDEWTRAQEENVSLRSPGCHNKQR